MAISSVPSLALCWHVCEKTRATGQRTNEPRRRAHRVALYLRGIKLTVTISSTLILQAVRCRLPAGDRCMQIQLQIATVGTVTVSSSPAASASSPTSGTSAARVARCDKKRKNAGALGRGALDSHHLKKAARTKVATVHAHDKDQGSNGRTRQGPT